jgi:hypothetical protein
MIELVLDSFEVYQESVLPAIKFKVKENVDDDVLPLGINGQVSAVDGKYLTNLIELPSNEQQHHYQSRIKTINDPTPHSVSTYEHELIFTFDKRSLDYVEERRYDTKNADVILSFTLTQHLLRPSLKVGSFAPKQFEDDNFVIVTDPSINRSNNIRIILHESGRSLFHHEIKTTVIKHNIPASTWVNVFQGPLGIGKFLIVEVPQPEIDQINCSATMTTDQITFKERVDRAFTTLQEMEEELRNGEWGTVVLKLRDIELFKKNVTQFIKKMVSQTTAMEEEKVGELTLAIDKLLSYASELHHVVDSRGNIKEVYSGGKEDAYMAFMLATSLTNLLARKFKTIVDKST